MIRKHSAAVAALLVAGIVVVGGQVAAAPPDSDDEQNEERAEAAVEKWLRSQGANAFHGTVACGVDSVSSHSVYCYAHTSTGIVAVSAPIPTTTLPRPTDLAGTIPTTTNPDLATTTAASLTSTFGDGLQLVDVDVLPGRYQAAGSDFCYWERLSEPTTDDTDAILANAIVHGPVVADILESDVAFNSSGCGTWSFYTPPAAPVDTARQARWLLKSGAQPALRRVACS